MRAITVRQPWAWAIVAGGKDVENRVKPDPWRTAIGERVAVHAGLTPDAGMAELDVERLAGRDLPDDARTLGAVIGSVVITGVHYADDCRIITAPTSVYCTRWAQPGHWHLTLADPVPRPRPAAARGALGLWRWDGDA